jgi:Fe-S cluster biogenesis protein NfuA
MPGQTELQRRLGSIEDLLGQIEASADPSLRASVQELVELVMNLHGAGLERMMEIMRSAGDPGEAVIQKVGRDELCGSLLILHGIHPLSFDARILQALEKVRGRLRPHGAEVELTGCEDGAVRLRFQMKTQGCGSTTRSLKEMVEEAVYQAAPDLTSLTIEDPEEKPGFVLLETLLASRSSNGATL